MAKAKTTDTPDAPLGFRQDGTPRTPKGRPPKAQERFDHKFFEGMLAARATEEYVTMTMGISISTLHRCIRKQYGKEMTFEKISERFATNFATSLRMRTIDYGFNGRPAGGRSKKRVYDGAMLRHIHKVYGRIEQFAEPELDPDEAELRRAQQQGIMPPGVPQASDAPVAIVKPKEVEQQRVVAVLDLLKALRA